VQHEEAEAWPGKRTDAAAVLGGIGRMLKAQADAASPLTLTLALALALALALTLALALALT